MSGCALRAYRPARDSRPCTVAPRAATESNDDVDWLGRLDADRIVEELLAADVFVYPSHVDNSPNSVVEAMAVGVPIVASCVGGSADAPAGSGGGPARAARRRSGVRRADQAAHRRPGRGASASAPGRVSLRTSATTRRVSSTRTLSIYNEIVVEAASAGSGRLSTHAGRHPSASSSHHDLLKSVRSSRCGRSCRYACLDAVCAGSRCSRSGAAGRGIGTWW